MNDALVLYLVVAVNDLIHEGKGLGFGKGSSAGDHFGEVSAVAEFGDDVGVVAGVVDVVDFDDVLAVFEGFQDFNF